MEWPTSIESISNWLLQSTFQAMILICAIFAVKLIVRRKLSTSWHYALWVLLLVRMVFPWGFNSEFGLSEFVPDHAKQSAFEFVLRDLSKFSLSIPDDQLKLKPIDVGGQNTGLVMAKDSSSSAGTETKQSGILTGTRIADLLFGVWLLGVLLLAAAVFRANLKLFMALKQDKKLTCTASLGLLEECKRDLKISTSLSVIETSQVKTPALFGFFKPQLLLPVSFVQSLSRKALRHIFLHELAHIKRGDVFVGWVVTVLQITHWFNPLVWFAFRRMRSDRELATDGLALSIMNPNEPVQYGHTIIQMLKLYSKTSRLRSMTGVLEQNSQVKRRMEMISDFKKKSYKWSPVAIVVLVVIGCMSLPEADLDTSKVKETPKVETAEKVVQKQPVKEQTKCIPDGLKESLFNCDMVKEQTEASNPKATKQCDKKYVKTTWDKALKLHVETVGNEDTPGTLDQDKLKQVLKLYDELLTCADVDKMQIKGDIADTHPTYYRMAYFKADLLWEMKDWNRCGDAYHQVIKIDPGGEYTQGAAYAEVLCNNKVFRAKHPEDEKKDASENKTKEVKQPLIPRKLDDVEKKLVASQKQFACLAPKDEALVDIKYRTAKQYYEANMFEESSILFEDIATRHPQHKLATFSANLHLDSLNALASIVANPNPQCLDVLKGAVDEFMNTEKIPGKHLMQDKEFATQITKLKADLQH